MPNDSTQTKTHLTDSDYARVEQMLAPYRTRRVHGSPIQPQRHSDGERFWYQMGTQFVAVNPSDGSRTDAFDHDRLAAGWLAFARIGMGYPLLALALLVTYWAVRRTRGRADVGQDECGEMLATSREHEQRRTPGNPQLCRTHPEMVRGRRR